MGVRSSRWQITTQFGILCQSISVLIGVSSKSHVELECCRAYHWSSAFSFRFCVMRFAPAHHQSTTNSTTLILLYCWPNKEIWAISTSKQWKSPRSVGQIQQILLPLNTTLKRVVYSGMINRLVSCNVRTSATTTQQKRFGARIREHRSIWHMITKRMWCTSLVNIKIILKQYPTHLVCTKSVTYQNFGNIVRGASLCILKRTICSIWPSMLGSRLLAVSTFPEQ